MADGFQEQYEVAAEELLGALPSDCGMPESIIATAEKLLGVRIPLALRDYYLAVGNLRRLNEAHNRLLAPEDWFLDAGNLVFMAENQRVVFWGTAALESPEDDPPVLKGIYQLPMPFEWYLEHPQCSEFLLIMLHWQAVCGGLEWVGMADIGQEVIAHFKRCWQLVGKQQGIVAFRHKGQAACIMGEGNTQQLYVGANSEELFERIKAELEPLGVGLDQL